MWYSVKGAALASGTSSPQTNLLSASEPAKVMPQCRQKSLYLRRLHLGLKKAQGSSDKITFHLQAASCLHHTSQICKIQPCHLVSDPLTLKIRLYQPCEENKAFAITHDSQPCISRLSAFGFTI